MTDTTDAALDALVMKAHRHTYKADHDAGLFVLDLAEAITALRTERDAWKAQCEDVERESAKCFSAQEEIDAAWDAFGTSGNRKVLSLAEQIASHQREVDGARDAALARESSAYARGVHAAADLCWNNAVGLQPRVGYVLGEWTEEHGGKHPGMAYATAIRALADAPPAPQCRGDTL